MIKLILILLSVAAIVVVMVMWQGNKYKKFVASAGRAEGVILDVDYRLLDTKTQRKEYWVFYKFKLGDTEYAGEDKVEYDDLVKGFEKGQKLDIYYNKENPRDNYPVAILDRRIAIANKLSH